MVGEMCEKFAPRTGGPKLDLHKRLMGRLSLARERERRRSTLEEEEERKSGHFCWRRSTWNSCKRRPADARWPSAQRPAGRACATRRKSRALAARKARTMRENRLRPSSLPPPPPLLSLLPVAQRAARVNYYFATGFPSSTGALRARFTSREREKC